MKNHEPFENKTYGRWAMGFLILIIFGTWLNKTREPQEIDKAYPTTIDMLKDSNDPVVGFDWQTNKPIKFSQADSLVYTGGRWYTKANAPKTHSPMYTYSSHEINWIRPAGADFKMRNDAALERLWQQQQKMKQSNQQLTEEDVREIVQDELDGNH